MEIKLHTLKFESLYAGIFFPSVNVCAYYMCVFQHLLNVHNCKFVLVHRKYSIMCYKITNNIFAFKFVLVVYKQ